MINGTEQKKGTLHSPGTSGRTDDLLIRFDALVLRPHQAFESLKTGPPRVGPRMFFSRHIDDMPGSLKDVFNFVNILASDFFRIWRSPMWFGVPWNWHDELEKSWSTVSTLSVTWKSPAGHPWQAPLKVLLQITFCCAFFESPYPMGFP